MTRTAFVIGGTGQIGRAVAARLLDDGWEVRLTSRGRRPVPADLAARGAQFVSLDREVPGALCTVLAGGADAVIDTVAYDGSHAEQLLAVQRDVGSVVVISSASVYRDNRGRTLDEADQHGFPDFPAPVTESQPIVPPGPATYSTRKSELEHHLLDHSSGPVTVLRPAAIHGPHSAHPREWWFVKRMLDGRDRIPLAYRGESRFHPTATVNIAELVATTLDSPGTRVLNIADPDAPTVLEIGRLIGAHLGWSGRIVPLDLDDGDGTPQVGSSPWSVPGPFVVSTDAAVALGYRPVTDYAGAVGAVVDDLREQDPRDWRDAFPVLTRYSTPLFDYEAEDAYWAEHPGRG